MKIKGLIYKLFKICTHRCGCVQSGTVYDMNYKPKKRYRCKICNKVT